ncbi:MAG: hypothetical protein K8W52_36295 [Deltaproteobacteria bacterium]|nr:hypothetical protein [Deltaproteobacteria bacterium]
MTRRSLFAVLRVAWLPTVGLVVAGMMARNFYLVDPYDPGRTGTALYGHNDQNSLHVGLLLMAIELAVALALLLPWPQRWRTARTKLGLGLFLPWTMVSALMVMHGSGVLALHLLWVTVVMLTFAVRSIGDASARRRAATGRR